MKNPYEVLGVPNGAPIEQVKAAYKECIRQYQDANYQTGPLADIAKKRMEELDAAYDQIIMNARPGEYTRQEYNAGESAKSYGYAPDYSDIHACIRAGRLEDAQMLLDGIPEAQRYAEWYYLKGTVQQRRGWLEEAARNFETARNMDPQNSTYNAACENIRSARSGGYKVKNTDNDGSDCHPCRICSGLLCADCCCEAMGGDLIPCC